jgi:hypothetical protein
MSLMIRTTQIVRSKCKNPDSNYRGVLQGLLIRRAKEGREQLVCQGTRSFIA